ncbi:hypothetical protein D9M68_89990 [compost metagenome]
MVGKFVQFPSCYTADQKWIYFVRCLLDFSALFCSMSSSKIADMIRSARHSVCYAAPGVQLEVANAMMMAGATLGREMLTVCLDFDERIMRMGYGEIGAVQLLLDEGISVRSIPGLRTALVIVDEVGFIFTPTALYLEPESRGGEAPNALRMSSEQMAEALARLSPAAKAIAIALAKTSEEKERIKALPLDVGSEQITDLQYAEVSISLEKAAPVRFDLARQVRVFEPYLQYVELSLTGAAIQRHRLAIPQSIQKLGENEELVSRLRTTFELIEKGSKLSSKHLEDALNVIRKDFTRSLGKDGRVVLKAAKPYLLERLADFRVRLARHQSDVAAELQKHLDESRAQIVAYYLPRVLDMQPDALRGQVSYGKISEEDARHWIDAELNRVFPSATALVQEMKLDERFKEVTFETLNRDDFLEAVKIAYPKLNWDKAHRDFLAAGESDSH